MDRKAERLKQDLFVFGRVKLRPIAKWLRQRISDSAREERKPLLANISRQPPFSHRKRAANRLHFQRIRCSFNSLSLTSSGVVAVKRKWKQEVATFR